MTTLTSVTPSSNIHTSVIKKVDPYPTPRLRIINQDGPTVTPISQSLPQMRGMNSENIKNGRDSKATPRSWQNLSYPTPPRNADWFLSPPPGWKPPTYMDALVDPERYTRVDPHNYFTHLPGQNDPNLLDRDPRKVPLRNSYDYSSRRTSDYTCLFIGF